MTLEAPPAPAATGAGPASFGSLLRAEALRLWSRRLVRVLVGLGLVGLIATFVIASTQYATPSADALDQARATRQSILDQNTQNHEQCLAAVGTEQGPPTADDCGPQPQPDDVGPVESFVAHRPFTLNSDGRNGVLATAAGASVIAFLIGATVIGAEWSSRSIVAWLFWVPRRRRVMAAKLTVLAAAVAALGVLGEALWLLGAQGLAALRGAGAAAPDPHWAGLLAAGGRGALLVTLAGLIGFGLANLIRNTAAALGAGFVYFVIVENVVRVAAPSCEPWLLTNNAVALVQSSGLRLYLYNNAYDGGREIIVSNLHGGLVIGAATAVVVGVSVLVFTRRDLN